jgi:hypothetical protein
MTDKTPVQNDLPTGWRHLSSMALEQMLMDMDDDTVEYDAIEGELAMRYSAESDPRIAQMLGDERGNQ